MKENELKNLFNSYISSIKDPRIQCGIYISSKGSEDYLCTPEFNKDTQLPIASLSKQLTSSIIVDKPELLNIDLTLISSSLSNKTVLELLNHTSGIPEYIFLPTEEELNKWSIKEHCDFILNIKNNESDFCYSNSNYILLSYLLELYFKKPITQVLASELFKPLQMKNSHIFNSSTDIKLFEPTASGWHETKPSRSIMGWGDSGVISTLEDLNIWLESNLLENLKNKIIESSENKYALGLAVSKSKERTALYHSGSTAGAESFMFYDISSDFKLVYLSNHNSKKSFDLFPRMHSLLNLKLLY